jgi:protein ImuA
MAGSLDGRQVRIEALRRQIAQAASFSARAEKTAPLGIADVDACLNGGLVRGALHEIAAADHRSIPAALGFLLALTSISLFPSGGEGDAAIENQKSEIGGRGKTCVLWPLAKQGHAFGMPYAPGLRFFGLDPARILFVRCAIARDCLWTMEEGLRLGGIAAVIGTRVKSMDLTASRRLQLAAEQANTPVFLLRHYHDSAPSAAVTRWRVAPAPSARDTYGFYERARFHVALDYARGGKQGEWVMEWNHEAHSLRLSSALGDRAAGEDRAA